MSNLDFKFQISIVTFAAALLAFGFAGQLRAAPMPGQRLYEETCSRCHGTDGRGEKAPWLVPFGWNYTQAIDKVRRGGACGMPAFTEDELSDENIKQIVDYLKTLN